MPYISVDVNVELDDFSDDELVQELERRKIVLDNEDNADVEDIQELVEKIYMKRLFGLDFLKEVDELIYHTLGRII